MAPDLNSVPPSPRLSQPAAAATQAPAPAPSNPNSSHHSSSATASHPSSRRASQLSPMNPPPLPLGAAATNGAAPTSQPQQTTIQPFPPLSPHLPGTAPRGSLDESGVPMRHPRPLTAAELHHELELEQEAVVNRLTRELSALRAHSASVASSVSSTSTSAHPSTFLFEATDPSTVHAGALTGPTHPTASRRHRSSSSVSRASQPHRWSMSSQSQAQGPPQPQQTDGAGSGVISGSSSTYAAGVGMARSPSLGVGTSAAARFEEAALHRQELEEAKRENELLRKRIRELEVELRGRRSSGGPGATTSPRETSENRSAQPEETAPATSS
ncbi:uncharacterized protein LTHEOB_5388 [Neofusicoccum parvum]|uniref:Uncharacterized protein n=1 Tax=Botryosphaeria parva (strain UCR-NP2) TaxID=1287680 RepID=R1GG00_BOTPV|nr:hypothetical protein UCRNP2_6046 [Neofusicoccum parvum UCRNP2]GME63878.1 uncharacterized protein LTHEOB_5388 [Neofusicoccum parvum]